MQEKDKRTIKGQPIKEVETSEVKNKTADVLRSENEEYYQTLFDTIPHGIQEIDTSGSIIFVNKAYDRIYGCEEGEVIGTSMLDKLVLDSERDKLRAYLKRLLIDQPTPTPYFEKNRTKEGRIIDVQVDWNYKRDNEGRIVGFISVITDITERKQAEAKLIEMKDYLGNIIESSLDPIVVTDMGGYFTRVNKAFLQLLGFSKAEVIGKHMSEFSPTIVGTYECSTGELIQINEEFYNYVESKMLLFMDKGIVHNAIGYLLCKDNKIVPVEDNMVYLTDTEDMRIGAVAITRDITERIKAEEKLYGYQSQLKELTSDIILTEERERRRFAEFLHDEIGQQLFAIQLQLKLLRGSVSSVNNTKTLDNAINYIKNVIDQSRSLTFELSPPILHQLGLEKALEWLAEQTHKKYDIKVTLTDDKQEKPLDDDMKIFLYQAVRELLINVAKHAQTENASVYIGKDYSNIQICVEDKGVGFVSPNKHSSDAKIEGFGLFRIKERLDQFGGQIKIRSQPNHGTHVTLVAPLGKSV